MEAEMKMAERFAALFFIVSICTGSIASAQSNFYEGQTITMIEGRDPGGTGDMRVQAALPFLRKYIPGQPTIIVQFMPGGGGRKAANHIYNNAKPDGLTLANVGGGLIANAVLGATGVQYELDKLILLGAAQWFVALRFQVGGEAGA
jgi:tripartite-type tricarboxylate transporter receptor subunit TctC